MEGLEPCSLAEEETRFETLAAAIPTHLYGFRCPVALGWQNKGRATARAAHRPAGRATLVRGLSSAPAPGKAGFDSKTKVSAAGSLRPDKATGGKSRRRRKLQQPPPVRPPIVQPDGRSPWRLCCRVGPGGDRSLPRALIQRSCERPGPQSRSPHRWRLPSLWPAAPGWANVQRPAGRSRGCGCTA